MESINYYHMSYEEQQALVIDCGSAFCKAGFSGEDKPRSVFPTIVGTARAPSVLSGVSGNKESYIGWEAHCRHSVLNINQPIQYGQVTDWNEWEQILHHCFYHELKAAPEEQAMLIAEPPHNTRVVKEKMLEIMFETFSVPALYFSIQAVLSLYASGRTTGLVLDCGHGVSSTVPIFEGFSLSHAASRLKLGGQDVTEYLTMLLTARKANFLQNPSQQLETVTKIKEKLGYIALEYEEELVKADQSSALDQTYQLPDGREITVSQERFKSTEVLFQPAMIGKEARGIHDIIFESINKSDIDIRRDMYRNIVINGGSTFFEGMVPRLQKELTMMAPSGTDIRIIATNERKYSAWLGGSILSSLSTFQDLWIPKSLYEERGADIL